MHYELAAPLQAGSIFEDEGFSVKGKEYAYSEILSVTVIGTASIMTNAVIQISLNGGKFVICAYDKKHKEDGDAVASYLKNYVAKQERKTIATEVGDLTTAKGLYRFCVDNGYGKGFNESWGIQHFQLIVDSLMPGECVFFPFIGLHNYVSATKHDNNFAYAVTNKRILMAQKKMIGQTIQTVSWENVNDITFNSGVVFGVITIDTIKETFNVAIDKISAQKICNRVHEAFEDIRKSAVSTPTAQAIDTYESVKKLKELLDLGIISQEEFDVKKKELLGL